jgi:hypothetical protein
MAAQIDNAQGILGNAFREARELLEVSLPNYGRLLEMDAEALEQIEQGILPVNLDDKLLKLVLATVAIRSRVDFIEPLLIAARERYDIPDLFNHDYPLHYLFKTKLASTIDQYRWISEGAIFRCRLTQLTDQPNAILFWAEIPDVHNDLVTAIPGYTNAHISLLNDYTLIFIPAAFLFLKFDTTAPDNPLAAVLGARFKEGLPIGLTLPRQPFASRSPTADEVAETEQRLFIYSPDPGSITEILVS